MLLRPRDGARWIKSYRAKQTPIEMGLPWISWGCIDFLTSRIGPTWNVFEWGGGGSTIFFLRHGCRVTTAETHEGWKSKIEEAAVACNGRERLQIRYFDVAPGAPGRTPFLETVRDGGPWDIVLVDGVEYDDFHRVHCIEKVKNDPNLLSDRGFLMLDDAWRPIYRDVPQLLTGWTRRSYKTLGPARMGVTQTDVYFPPGSLAVELE
jgi:hypothetical protein